MIFFIVLVVSNKWVGRTASVDLAMGSLPLFSLLLVTYSTLLSAQIVEYATIVFDGTEAVANTDDNYICATIDWWPPEKCNYRQCPWGSASILNLVNGLPLHNFSLSSAFALCDSFIWYENNIEICTLSQLFQDLSHPFLINALRGLWLLCFV